MIKIDGFVIDAALRIESTFDAEITELPVERGSAIADHKRTRPFLVVIEGVVSDTPLPPVADLREEGSVPSADARIFLFDLWQSDRLVTIETEDATFTNMLLQTFVPPQDGTTGDACHFTATFKHVRLVTNKRTSVPVSTPRASKKVSRGTVPSPAVAPDGPAQPPPAGAIEDVSTINKALGRTNMLAEAAKAGSGT